MLNPSIVGLRGPHFSLALFGPLNPTRAVTSPAWRVPLARKGILPLLFPKEPVPASPPSPISGRDHPFWDIAQKRRASSFSTAGLRLAVC